MTEDEVIRYLSGKGITTWKMGRPQSTTEDGTKYVKLLSCGLSQEGDGPFQYFASAHAALDAYAEEFKHLAIRNPGKSPIWRIRPELAKRAGNVKIPYYVYSRVAFE